MEDLASLKEEVKNWADEKADDTNNLMHRYFEATQLRHWCEVANEAQHVYELMFGMELEEDSPLDALISGVAAQAADGVWHAVAEAFGLEKEYVHLTLAHYEELELGQDRIPPMTVEGFMVAYKKTKETWENDTYFEEKLCGDN